MEPAGALLKKTQLLHDSTKEMTRHSGASISSVSVHHRI